MEKKLISENLNTMRNSDEPTIKSVGELLKIALPEYLCIGESSYSDGDIGVTCAPVNDSLIIRVTAGIDTETPYEIAEMTVKFR